MELKPCPWCGSTSIDVMPDDICCPIQYSAIGQCSNCGAECPEGSGVYDSKEDAIEDAIKAWNQRKGE